ncbi:hypothetical protein [Vibrio harveyi]|uniref:hypothetical protein n=1 Tax=Vibrio harveyi TaxID=669 RepID=UPI003D705B40
MPLNTEERIWAEMALQNCQTSGKDFDHWHTEIKQRVALNMSNQMKAKYTEAQFKYQFPNFDIEAANNYLIELVTGK